MKTYICPECAGGKCLNCTVQVLGDDDQWYPCDCPHPPFTSSWRPAS